MPGGAAEGRPGIDPDGGPAGHAGHPAGPAGGPAGQVEVDAAQRRGPPDLRLVAPAMAAWAAVLVGIHGGPAAAIGVTALAAGLTAWSLRRGRPAWIRAVAGCTLAAGVVISAHAALVAWHPLRAAAQHGAAATVRVQLRDDPRPIRAAAYGAQPGNSTQVLIASTVQQAQAAGGRWVVGGRILLIAPAAGWDRLLPGQAATAEGLLAPAGRSDLTVAVLRVRGPPRLITEPPWWQNAAGGLRAGLREAAGVLPPASAGLLPGLTVGDTSRLTTEVEADFRVAGLTHLLAVSGDKARQKHVCCVDVWDRCASSGSALRSG